jgi:putative transposase
VDYIHWNPVKHGCVRCVADWPHSSFHDYVRRGVYPEDWGGEVAGNIEAGE